MAAAGSSAVRSPAAFCNRGESTPSRLGMSHICWDDEKPACRIKHPGEEVASAAKGGIGGGGGGSRGEEVEVIADDGIGGDLGRQSAHRSLRAARLATDEAAATIRNRRRFWKLCCLDCRHRRLIIIIVVVIVITIIIIGPKHLCKFRICLNSASV